MEEGTAKLGREAKKSSEVEKHRKKVALQMLCQDGGFHIRKG